MNEKMKCKCGFPSVVKPKSGQRIKDYLETKRCPRCKRIGEWKILSENEEMMD